LFLFRRIYLKYKDENSVNSIPTYRFTLPEELITNVCDCLTPANPAKCDGIFDIGSCFANIPLAISFPHFLHSSRLIRNTVRGMKPDIETHESSFDIEPVESFL
jgi:hypothetical protein